MQSKVSDAWALHRERELLQHGKCMRQHFRTGEVGEPKAEIKRIGHNRLEIVVSRATRSFHDCKLSEDRVKETARRSQSGGHSTINRGRWRKGNVIPRPCAF